MSTEARVRSRPTDASAGRTVVVLDDDPGVRRALQRLLEVDGFRVIAFASPEELLDGGAIGLPDCLVIDIHLAREVTGFEAFDCLRASGLTAPVVFITAFDDDATRLQAARAGAAAYLCKPFDSEELIAAVRAAAG